MALGSLGDAYASLRVETKKVPGDVKDGLRKASADAEQILDGIGETWGEHLADSTSDELRRHGKDFGNAVSDAIDHEVIHIRGKRFKIDRRGFLHDAAGRFASRFTDEVEDAFDNVIGGGGRGGGPFGRIGQAMADAIGAGFNISGKSPLIAFLVPAVGSIVGLVIGAIQSVQSLVAIFTTLPALLASIGVQVGVLGIAFGNLGKAINVILNAESIEDIDEVLKDIKGLTPEARNFVKSFIPLRELIKEVKSIVRTNFFKNIGDPLGFIKFLTPSVVAGFGQVATAMGRFFAQLGMFFNSPTFITFVKDIFPATTRWIQRFGPTFIKVLGSLLGMADQALPVLERLGSFISLNLASLSRVLNETIARGAFRKWALSMFHTFELFVGVLISATRLIGSIMSTIDQAGGDNLLQVIIDALEQLVFFFTSPAGIKAMEGLINAAIISIQVFVGLLEAILLVVAAIQVAGEAIKEFWRFLTTVVGPAIGDFFSWLGTTIADTATGIWQHLTSAANTIKTSFNSVVAAVRARINDAIAFVQGLPGRARAAIGSLDNLLYNAGRNMIQGFINGIRSRISDAANAAKSVISAVTDWFPGSPAKVGPLSGQGYAQFRGERMVQDFGSGMRSGFGALQTGLASDLGAMVDMIQPGTNTSNAASFGPGSVVVKFEGVVPTKEEAYRTGQAVGAGINDQMTKRSTVLAVRTL